MRRIKDMESGGRRYALKALAIALGACFAQAALPMPTAPVVVNGTASFAQTGDALTVTNSNRAVINWNGFSIGRGESVRFVQPDSASSVLNRVLLADPSVLLGVLQSNGRVLLINPAGILVGAGARIDTAGFVASTLNLSNDDFLAGRLNFVTTPGAGSVRVESGAEIRSASGGYVYLVAPQVDNAGLITAPSGEIILAAGQQVEIVDSATPGVRVAFAAGGEARNLGQLLAESGRVGMVGAVVRQQGVASADSLVREGGRVFLRATQKAELAASSTTSASGTEGGRVDIDGGEMTLVSGRVAATGSGTGGGHAELLGDKVGVLDGAVVDASGASGGGSVLVGGDYQGKNPEIRNAQISYLAKDATLKADARDSGNGGKVIVWADDTTRAYGSISAKGGAYGGDGGFVETSGHRHLDVAGARADTTAAQGTVGQWLLDPGEVNIVSGTALVNISAGPAFTPLGGISTLGDSDINSMLASSNVTITTSGGSGGSGDITLASGVNINYSSGVVRSLTLSAENDISLQGTIRNSSTGGGLFSVYLNATGNIVTPSSTTFTLQGGGGTAPILLQINGGKTWNNYGSVTLDGRSQIRLHDGTSPAAFHNKPGGIFTTNSVYPTGYSFFSTAADDGEIANWGTFTFGPSATATSIEAIYNQYSGGILELQSSGTVSLQNAQTIEGTINFAGTSTLWISENHGVAARFDGTSMTGTGTIVVKGSVGTPEASFTNVTAGGVTLGVGDGSLYGIASVYDGNSLFGGLSVDPTTGSFTLSSALLGINGALAIPANASYYGDAAYLATGNITGTTIAAGTADSLTLVANWNSSFSSPAATSGAGSIAVTGAVSAPKLDAQAANGIALNGGNLVDDVSLSSLAGNVSYHTANTGTTHIKSISATGNIAVVGDSGSGNIALDSLVTSGASTVSVSAQKAILDDNGDGVANITNGTGTVTLTSASGTPNSGELAISADVDSAAAVTATTSGGAYGSIEIRDVGTNALGGASLNASAATAEGSVSYYRYGNVNFGGGTSLSLTPKTAERVAVGASGDITFSSGSITLAGGTSSVSAGGNLTFDSGSSVILSGDGSLSAGGDLTVNGGAVTLQGSTNTVFAGGAFTITSGSLSAGTGSLDVLAASASISGTLSAYGDLSVLVADALTLAGGSMTSSNGDLYFLSGGEMTVVGAVGASNGSVTGAALGGLVLGSPISGSGTVFAGNGAVDLTIGGSGIEMYNGSYISSVDATQPYGGQITLFFPGLSGGGSTIDGVATFDGGYKVGGSFTTIGSGLDVIYGVLYNPVAAAINSEIDEVADSAGGSGEVADSLLLVDKEGAATDNGASEGESFGGTTQEKQNAKKKPAQCSA